ncbi:hypothetical protein FRC00_004724 [Tulasnella sp. 408]|nr:hypothetical protein FRC00_004724 [Tulasnella sp. 408]
MTGLKRLAVCHKYIRTASQAKAFDELLWETFVRACPAMEDFCLNGGWNCLNCYETAFGKSKSNRRRLSRLATPDELYSIELHSGPTAEHPTTEVLWGLWPVEDHINAERREAVFSTKLKWPRFVRTTDPGENAIVVFGSKPTEFEKDDLKIKTGLHVDEQKSDQAEKWTMWTYDERVDDEVCWSTKVLE